MDLNLTFSRGERLTADKMNRLVNGLGQNDVDGLPFKGGCKWAASNPQTRHAMKSKTAKPFDLAYRFNLSDVIDGISVTNCEFYEGSVKHSLSVQIVATEFTRSVESINLYEIELSDHVPANPRFRVMDNIEAGLEYPKEDGTDIKAEWTLYKMDNAFVKEDLRDAMVQIGGGNGSATELDLSSTNWISAKVQNWNYADPQTDDKAEIQKSNLSDYRLLARPEEGGTLKYASLSTLISEISGGGGSGSSLSGNTSDSAKIAGDMVVQKSLSTNLSVYTYDNNKIRFEVLYI